MFEQIVELAPSEILKLTWEKNYVNLTISLNGEYIDTIPDKPMLKLGKTFKLGDNRQFILILSGNRLALWHNQFDLLSGVRSGTRDYFTNTVWVLIVIGSLFFVYDSSVALAIFPSPNFHIILALLSGPGLTLVCLGIWAKISNHTQPLKLAAGAVLVILIARSFLIPHLNILSVGLLFLLLFHLYLGIKHNSIPSQRPTVVDKDSPLDHGI